MNCARHRNPTAPVRGAILAAVLSLVIATPFLAAGAAPIGVNSGRVQTFDSAPPVAEWATFVGLPGASGDIATATQLDAAVQALPASGFTSPLEVSSLTNPAPSVGLLARYNSSGRYLQSRPGGGAATVFMATLQNDTGYNNRWLTLAYDFRPVNPPHVTILEQVPGLRAYYSLTGTPNSWQLVPELSTDSPSPVWVRLDLQFWTPGAPLYLLWADDNSSANADNLGDEEGAYTIDNFTAFTDRDLAELSGVRIFNPVDGQQFPEGSAIEITAFSTPGLVPATNVLFLDGTNLLGRVAASQFPVRFLRTNAAPGLHQFTAVALNSGIALPSVPVSVTVTAYRPRLTITALGFGFSTISWPEPSTGFELQSATALTTGIWALVVAPDAPANGFHHVEVDTSSGTRFFRLEKR